MIIVGCYYQYLLKKEVISSEEFSQQFLHFLKSLNGKIISLSMRQLSLKISKRTINNLVLSKKKKTGSKGTFSLIFFNMWNNQRGDSNVENT